MRTAASPAPSRAAGSRSPGPSTSRATASPTWAPSPSRVPWKVGVSRPHGRLDALRGSCFEVRRVGCGVRWARLVLAGGRVLGAVCRKEQVQSQAAGLWALRGALC